MTGPYQAGRSKHWVKVKNRKHPAMVRVMDGGCGAALRNRSSSFVIDGETGIARRTADWDLTACIPIGKKSSLRVCDNRFCDCFADYNVTRLREM